MIYDGVCLFLPNWCVAMRFLMFFRFQQDFSIWPLRLSVFCSLFLASHKKMNFFLLSRIWIVRNVCTQSFCSMALLFCCISAFKILLHEFSWEYVDIHIYMCGFLSPKNILYKKISIENSTVNVPLSLNVLKIAYF